MALPAGPSLWHAALRGRRLRCCFCFRSSHCMNSMAGSRSDIRRRHGCIPSFYGYSLYRVFWSLRAYWACLYVSRASNLRLILSSAAGARGPTTSWRQPCELFAYQALSPPCPAVGFSRRCSSCLVVVLLALHTALVLGPALSAPAILMSVVTSSLSGTPTTHSI